MSSRTGIIILITAIVAIIFGYIAMLSMYITTEEALSPSIDLNTIVDNSGRILDGSSDRESDMSIAFSGNLSTGSTISGEKRTVSIIMPGWLLTTQLQSALDQLANTKHIVVSIQTVFDWDEYQTILKKRFDGSDHAGDIVLVPTIRRDSIAPETQKLQFPESLSPYFHALWQPLVDNSDHTIIPRGIDPIVTYIRPEITIAQSPLLMSDLLNAVMIAPSLRKDSITLLRGMNPSDATMISNNRPRDTMRSWVSYLMISQLMRDQQTDIINQLIDFPKLNLIGGRNSTTIMKIALTLAVRQPSCKTEALLCLMRFGYGAILIAPLSDIERQERLFARVGTPLSEMQLRPRPRSGSPSTSQQPIIGRGRVIPKHTVDSTGAVTVLNTLINLSIKGTGSYQSLLPASMKQLTETLSDPLYYRIQETQPIRQLLRGSRDTPSVRAHTQNIVAKWR